MEQSLSSSIYVRLFITSRPFSYFILCLIFSDPTVVYRSVRVDDVASLMRANRLQLKTEVIWCSSSRRKLQFLSFQFQSTQPIITPGRSVRYLGILGLLYDDSDVSMPSHICCQNRIELLRSPTFVGQSSDRQTYCARSSLVSLGYIRLVLIRLDYGSATLAGLPRHRLLDSGESGDQV